MATVKIHSGLFVHPIQLDNPVKAQDIAGGNEETGWITLAITRGYFRKKSGFRDYAEGYDKLVWEYEAYMWWRNDLEANITKDTHLVYDNKIYEIVTWGRYEENRQFLEFRLVAMQ